MDVYPDNVYVLGSRGYQKLNGKDNQTFLIHPGSVLSATAPKFIFSMTQQDSAKNDWNNRKFLVNNEVLSSELLLDIYKDKLEKVEDNTGAIYNYINKSAKKVVNYRFAGTHHIIESLKTNVDSQSIEFCNALSRYVLESYYEKIRTLKDSMKKAESLYNSYVRKNPSNEIFSREHNPFGIEGIITEEARVKMLAQKIYKEGIYDHDTFFERIENFLIEPNEYTKEIDTETIDKFYPDSIDINGISVIITYDMDQINIKIPKELENIIQEDDFNELHKDKKHKVYFSLKTQSGVKYTSTIGIDDLKRNMSEGLMSPEFYEYKEEYSKEIILDGNNEKEDDILVN